jgi:hypothetical protein
MSYLNGCAFCDSCSQHQQVLCYKRSDIHNLRAKVCKNCLIGDICNKTCEPFLKLWEKKNNGNVW